MKGIWLLAGALLLAALGGDRTDNRSWSGLTPLHSTRDDVIRVLGQPGSENAIRLKYSLPEVEAYIVLAGEQTLHHDRVGKIATGTVLLIEINPRTKLEIDDFGIEEDKFTTFEPSEPPNIGYRGYVCDDCGVVLRTLHGKVDQIDYFPPGRERSKLCSSLYPDPRQLVHLLVH